MIDSYEDELICDLAEYYGIYDYEKMPPLYIATLACGLRDGSRVVSALNENPYPLSIMLEAGILDSVNLLAWLNSENGVKGRNRPVSVFDSLFPKKESEQKSTTASFDSGEAFEAARRKILGE